MKSITILFSILALSTVIMAPSCGPISCNDMQPIEEVEVKVAQEVQGNFPSGKYALELEFDAEQTLITWTVDESGELQVDTRNGSDYHLEFNVLRGNNETSISLLFLRNCPSSPIDAVDAELFFQGQVIDQFSIIPSYTDDPTEPRGEDCGDCWAMDNILPVLIVPVD